MRSPTFVTLAAAFSLLAGTSRARVVRLDIETRELVLSGQNIGLAGPYEKIAGTVVFALDPEHPKNSAIVDLALGPRDDGGDVRFTADFYLLKPLHPERGNGVLFYEAGNRGRKRILTTFQKAMPSDDPQAPREFGDGSLMAQGYTFLWMGWQWDVPEGRMRMDFPIATRDGEPIPGLVRANFIGDGSAMAPLADRGHRAYPVVDPESAEHRMTVRALPFDPPEVIPRDRWRFSDEQTVALDGGFEPGRIYDVVYRSRDPRIVGCGLAGTRDLVSFFKHETGEANPLSGIRFAVAWGVSQTGRFLRHFLYQGFNEDEEGRRVFDGVIDQVGGAGRGSFNHRFGQASRDALQHFNILYPVDMFPFTDAPTTDPATGETDGLLERAKASGTVPSVFHILTDSEYYNRAGSLIHTDPAGTADAEIPESSRIYFITSAPHIVGPFPPEPSSNPAFVTRSPLNPLVYDAVVRALFQAMVAWVVDDRPPPESHYPRLDDGTLVAVSEVRWPRIPGVEQLPEPQTPHRLDFGPDWERGIVSHEPPRVGSPFGVRVPEVDADGNGLAGIRLPEIQVPLATQTGWNYRHPSIGAPNRLASELGAYLAFPRTEEERARTGDPRESIEARYLGKDDYLGKIARAARELVRERLLLVTDLPEILDRAEAHYQWAAGGGSDP